MQGFERSNSCLRTSQKQRMNIMHHFLGIHHRQVRHVENDPELDRNVGPGQV